MTTFNTGNPIGSTDSRDRLDNSENADVLENSTTIRYHADRLGTVRKTRYGMQKEHDAQISAHESEHDAQISAHESEHDAQISAHDAEFDVHISGMAISNVGTFSAGYTLTNIRQSLRYTVDGYEYSWTGAFPKVVPAGSTPASAGGIGAGAWVVASIGASIATKDQTISRLSSNQVVSPAGLNAVVQYAPSVNPALDLDFAKQKYRWYSGAAGITESSTPSLMTFTRSSVATFFDAMGVMKQAAVNTPRIDYDPLTGECNGLLVEEQRTNLFPYSAYPAATSEAKWGNRINCDVYPNVAVAPDGTMTAAKAVVSVGAATTGNDGVGVFAAPSVTSSATHTLTLYVKDAGAGYLRIRESVNTGQMAKVNLTTGAITAEAEYTTTTFTVTTTNVGNGWWRVAVVRTPTTTVGFNLKPGIDVGDGVSGIYVWGAQLEAGSFPTSYIPTPAVFSARASSATYYDSNGVLKTAASGVARSSAYDYDADGVLRPIGLLLESAATNLLLYSEQFDNAAWTKLNATITANAVTAPDGNTTADKLVDTAVSGYHYASQSVAASASTTYTKSVYLKAGERSWAKLELYDGTSYLNAYFNLSTGSIGTISSGASASIRKANNGFWRCTITVTTSASATTLLGTTHVTTGDAAGVYTGDGVSGIYVWGAQLAAGNYATSYIATTSSQATRAADTSASAQATRAADNASISGANFSQWYKQYDGTVVVEVNNQTTTSLDSSGYGRGCAVLSDGTDINRIRIGSDAGISFVIKKGGVDQTLQTVGVVSVGKHKGALSFATNNINAAIDAVSATQDVSASIPYLTQLRIGKSTVTAGSGGAWSSHIRSLKYFPKALAATELQAMTA